MPDQNVDASVITPILKQIPLFAQLDDTLHQAIISQIMLMFYPAEYTIFNEGDPGDALYIIKKGGVEIFHPAKEAGDLPKKVAEIPANGFFGEMALVSDVPRNASVKTTQESEIFILKKEHFNELLATNPSLAQQVSAAVVSRVNENNKSER